MSMERIFRTCVLVLGSHVSYTVSGGNVADEAMILHCNDQEIPVKLSALISFSDIWPDGNNLVSARFFS